MNLDQNKTKSALKDLNWLALRQQLEVTDLTKNNLQALRMMVLRSDSMVRRRPGDDGTARDRLLQELVRYLREAGLEDAASEIANLSKIFLRIDRGYVAIFSHEETLPFSTLSPKKRVSAIFSFLADLAERVQLDYKNSAESSDRITPSLTIKDINGIPYNPNTTFHGFTLAATDALQLEGYRNSYFDAMGALVLPVPESASEKDKNSAGTKLLNASTWRRWKNIDERHRLLQASLEELTTPELPDWISKFKAREKITTAFEYFPRIELEIMDIIATERFDERMIQTFNEMLLETNALEIVASRSAAKVELPPLATVSVDEAHAGEMLQNFLGLHLDKTKAGALFLSERLRGYAVLQLLVRSSIETDGKYFPVLTRSEIQAELLRCGLSLASADAFIKAATFSRSSRDMYDQPMIRLSNGSYLIFGFSLLAANLVKLMISSLENAKLSFPKRGPAFEKQIIDLLREEGFDAKKLEVKRGTPKSKYDYDVTFVWGDYVFFMECKNRGIPFGNPIAIANFEDEINDHANQVKRLRQGLLEYPDIITIDHPQAIGKTPVFCVVFSLPFSMGHQDGVYYIDASLLTRFFESGGALGMKFGNLSLQEPRYRIEVAKLWTSDAPTPEDLIRYMENPPQLHLAKARYELEAKLFRLSEDSALLHADWSRKNLSDAEVAKILNEATQKGRPTSESKVASDNT